MTDNMTDTPQKPRLSEKEKLNKRIAQAAARLKDIEAREKSANRKADKRRLILWGRILTNDMLEHPDSDNTRRMQDIANRYYTRAIDRKLLDLKPSSAKAKD